jgi:hypothetical protein|tara:strand:+ start:5876 stop:6523 length:648 start_codon:yes stop_codon:yes gene_type:complete
MDNTELWDKVCTTDPAHTKHVNQRGGFTTIDAYHQVHNATAVFGPVGKGWGWDYNLVFQDGILIADMTMWWGGDRTQVVRQCGARSTHKRNGSVDEDAAKSAVTDALTKCLSYLGFNADVFLGKYDDNKYVQNLRQEKQKSQPKRVEQKHEQSDEEKTFHQLMQRIDSAKTLEEATAVGADASQVQINNKQAAQMLDDRIRGKILELSQGVLNNG